MTRQELIRLIMNTTGCDLQDANTLALALDSYLSPEGSTEITPEQAYDEGYSDGYDVGFGDGMSDAGYHPPDPNRRAWEYNER